MNIDELGTLMTSPYIDVMKEHPIGAELCYGGNIGSPGSNKFTAFLRRATCICIPRTSSMLMICALGAEFPWTSFDSDIHRKHWQQSVEHRIGNNA